MQDGQFPPINTPFEDQLVESGFGRLASIQNQLDPELVSRNQKIELTNRIESQINSIYQIPRNPVSPNVISPYQIDVSGRYKIQVLGEDNEDLYAQNQTWGAKAFNGLLKGLTLAGTTFLQGTVGLVDGIAEVIGSGGNFNKLYNSDFSNLIQEFNQKTEGWLPNYYKKEERDAAWYSPKSWFTANFLFDSFIKNLGFSIGAIYSGAAVTKALKLIGPINNLFTAGRAKTALMEIEKRIALIPATERIGETYNILRKTSDALKSAVKFGNITERAVVSTLGAVTEGGIEALQGLNEHRTNLINEYISAHGTPPTGEILDKINSNAENLGDARFLMNISLLTATNYIMLPKILNSSYKSSKALANLEVNNIAKNVEGKFIDAFANKTRVGKLLFQSKNAAGLLFSPTEGFEELSQYAIQLGVQDYYNKAYRGEGRGWVDSISEGWSDAVNSNEGMKQFLIGGLSGGLQQSGLISSKGFANSGYIAERGVFGRGGEKRRNTDSFISDLNNPDKQAAFKSELWLKDMQNAAARGINLQQEGEKLIRQGDVLESKDNEMDYLHNYLAARIKHGRYDLVKDDIANFQQQASTPEGLEALKQQGVANENDTSATFNQRLQNFSRHADNVNSLYQSLNLVYSGLVSKEDGERIYSDEVIDKMVYATSKIADYDQRIPEVANNLISKGILSVTETLKNIEDGVSIEKATKDTLEEINNLKKTNISEITDNLKSDFRDVIELSKRRRLFIEEYNDIKKDPSKYKEDYDYNGIQTTATIKQRNAEGKPVKKDVELNKEYSVESEPLFRDGNKISVNPKLTILSKTLGGEYEVKMPDGTTKYMKPNELKDYKLTETDQNNEELNTIITNTIYNILKQEGLGDAVKPEDSLEDLLSVVNTLNNNALVNKIQKAVRENTKKIQEQIEKGRKEQERLAKDVQLKKELEAYRDAASLKAGTLTLDENSPEELKNLDKTNDYFKAPLKSFLSKEADFYDLNNPKPHQKRRLSFLTNIARIQNSDRLKNIRVLAITKNNQKHFGLQGLIQWVEQDMATTLTDPIQREKYLNKDGSVKPIHTPIIKLYTVKRDNKLFLSDVNGNPLSELKGDVSQQAVNSGIFSTFHSTLSGAYEFGPHEGEPNYSKGTEEELKTAQIQFDAWRKATLALSTTSPEYPILSISRGIVLRDADNKPVTSTNLVSTEELDNEGIITIPTIEDQITVGDTSLNFPIGQPLLTNGSNIEFLNNRQFTEKEANDMFHFIKEFVTLITAKKKTEAQRLQNFLSSVLYLRSPKEGEQAISNAQIYFTNTGGIWNFHFGTALQTAFTPQSIENNKEQITNFFKQYYIKANNKILKENANLGFEYATINPQGETEYKQHPSYSRYLLSTPDTTPILQTRAIKSAGIDDPTIISRYTTLQSSEFDFVQAPIPIKEKKAKQEENIEVPEGTVFEEEQSLSGLFGPKKQGENKEEIPKKEKKPTGFPKGLFSGKKASQTEIDEIDRISKKYWDNLRKNAQNTDFDAGEFKLALSPIIDYTPIDVEKELAYIKEKSPFSVKILDDILKTPQGVYAWGSYKDRVIRLYKAAQEGTGIHELFEGVYKEFLSSKEKDNILKEFQERKGNFTYFDGNEYFSISHKEATEAKMKETLADELGEFFLTKEKPIKQGSAISRFFTNLWNFIKSIFTGDVQSIDQLFSKIDRGDYKSAPYNPNSISENEEYSLADLNYTQQYETIRGVALQVMQEVLNPNSDDSVSLTEFEESDVPIHKYYDAVYQRLKNIYTVGIYKDEMELNDKPNLQHSYEQVWKNISKDWDTIKALTNEYLKTFSIIESIRGEDGEDYAPRMERDNYSNREYADEYQAYFKNDAKQTSARSIKLLIATLPETIINSAGNITSKRTAASFMQVQVQYAKTFNHLLAQLTTVNGYEDKMKKLEELGESIPNFKRLYQRLISPSNTSNPNSVLNDWKLKIRFFQTMSKQSPTAYTQYNNQDGTSYTGTSDLQNSAKIISQGWIDSLKSLAISNTSKIALTDKEGNLILHTNQLNVNISTPEGKIEFLNRLNIPFTQSMYNGLSKDGRDKFNQATIGLSHQIRKKPIYPLEDARSLDSVKNLQALAEAFILAGNDFESTFPDINGERRTKFISTNKISRDVNDINQHQTKQALFQQMPQLEQIQDSVYLNSIIFNEKGEKKSSFSFDIGYIQGTVDKNQKPIPGDKLTEYQRLGQEINQNLNQRYYVLIPADSKTQWLLSMQNFVSFKNIAANSNDWLNRTLSQFTVYYNTEKQSYEKMKADGIKDLEERQGIFKELSNNYTLDDTQFKAALQEFFEFQANEQFKFLQKFHVIQPNGKKETYTWNNLDGDFLNKEALKYNKLTAEDIKNILLFRTINYGFNNTELQKLFFGDILNYKDANRYKLSLSPREISFTGSKDFNNFLNQHFNVAHSTKLKDPLLGKFTFSDYMKTVTMNDVTVANEALASVDKKYNDINSTDAQALSTLPAMRARRIKETSWTEKDGKQYEYRMAIDRLLMHEDGHLTDALYTKSMQNADTLLKSKGNPNSAYFYVEKPIYSGFSSSEGSYQPLVDKFSIASFSYSAIRHTNFREHYIKMLKQEIGYIVVKSGRKLGPQNSDSFYNEDGSVNTAPYNALVNINLKDFGVQTDNSSKKESQTRGTQITTEITANLYNNGEPINERAGQLVNKDKELLNELTEIGYRRLLKTIGATDVDGEYRIQNKEKVLLLVSNELLRREVADSIKQQLKLTSDGQLKTAFEALPNYQQIKNILYSYVDKYITSPKVGTGAPKTEVSGALMEKYGIKRVRVNGKYVYVSEGLKFYENEDGKRYMEVLLPAWVGRKLRKAGLEWNTEEELYNLFKNSPDAEKLLSGVGFRIPTQELNSIENFKIAGFLPEEMGDTIIVPEAITTKAGSDFDIDKLNTYLKNIYVDGKGQIRIIPYHGIGEEAKEKLKGIVSENNIKKLFSLTAKDRIQAYTGEQDKLEYDEELDRMENEEFLNEIYKQSIENEYFSNIQSILELPENFERLITPNTTDNTKAIRDILVDLAPSEFEAIGDKSIISPMYMLRKRHQAQGALSLVGIAAVSQTRTVKAQKSKIVIEADNFGTLSRGEQNILGPKKAFTIALPHNEIDGKPTLSTFKDLDDRYITDKNSEYINGSVDGWKDAFLAQLNFNNRTAGIYLMLEDLGVPNSKEHPIVSFYMNQPIIRQFLNRLDVEGIKSPTSRAGTQIVQEIKRFFPTKNPRTTSLPQSLNELTSTLSDSIKKYYNGVDLTSQENSQQQFMLDEYLRYSVLSNHLLSFQQGSNYDTATFNDSSSVFLKEGQRRKAEEQNIWTDVQKFMDNTHVQKQREAIISATSALKDVFTIENNITKQHLLPIYRWIGDKYIGNDEKIRLIRKLEESLLNFLVQQTSKINNSIHHMLVDSETALVNELKRFKKTTEDTDNIWGNIILKQLIPYIKGRTKNSTKNITLAVKARDIFSKNLYNSAFEQLLQHPKTEKLARSLVKLSFIQNGVSNSPISFKDAIPAEVYSAVMKEAIDNLQNEDLLQSFMDTNSFFRNNWDEENIVPTINSDKYPLTGHKSVIDYVNILKKQGSLNEEIKPPLVIWADRMDGNNPFLTHLQYSEEQADVPIPPIKRLFQRVDDVDGQPLIRTIEEQGFDGLPYTAKRVLYIHSNALGDSFRANEYYPTNQQSVFSNGYIKATPLNVNELYTFIEEGIVDAPIEENKPSLDNLKNNLPKKDCN